MHHEFVHGIAKVEFVEVSPVDIVASIERTSHPLVAVRIFLPCRGKSVLEDI
jgi:hypothetical protein